GARGDFAERRRFRGLYLSVEWSAGPPAGRAGRGREQTHHPRRLQEPRHALMDTGARSPFLDFFRRGEVARDVRLLAARGALAPRALDQMAILALLTEDGDP